MLGPKKESAGAGALEIAATCAASFWQALITLSRPSSAIWHMVLSLRRWHKTLTAPALTRDSICASFPQLVEFKMIQQASVLTPAMSPGLAAAAAGAFCSCSCCCCCCCC